MHVMKFNRGGMKRILAHVKRIRETVTKSEIDPEKTHLNVNLAPTITPERIQQIEGMAKRKDAILLVDTILTLPEELKYASRKKQIAFFQAGYEALKGYMGGEVAFATIHFDETTPHLHLGTIPLVDGRLNAKQYVNRGMLKSLHPVVEEYIREKGFDCHLYEVDEEKRLALHASGGSKRDMDEYRKHMTVESTREQYERETAATIEAHQHAMRQSRKPLKRKKGESKEEYKERKHDYVMVRRDVYDSMMEFRYDTKAVEDTAEARKTVEEARKQEETIKTELNQIRAVKSDLERTKAGYDRDIEYRANQKAQDWYREWTEDTRKDIGKGIDKIIRDLDSPENQEYLKRYLKDNPAIACMQTVKPELVPHHTHSRGFGRDDI